MSKNSPRWINEVPKPIQIVKKKKLTRKENEEAKKFEEAVKKGEINKWFNKKFLK